MDNPFREIAEQGQQVSMGLNTEKTRYEIVDGLSELDNVLESKTSTAINEDESITTEVSLKLHKLSCGHVVGTNGSSDILGKCQICGEWLCAKCELGSVCNRCNALLCPSCRKSYSGHNFCRRCRLIEIMKSILLFGFRRIHESLSAEL